MMNSRVEDLSDISIFPYYRGVSIEVDSVARKGVGRYLSGQFSGHTYYTLTVAQAELKRELHVGAAYSCTARGPDGDRIKTHWLYCTGLDPVLTFGISRNWRVADGFAPQLPLAEPGLIRLEELTELVALFPSQAPEGSLAQARIGRRGWLVMTQVGVPDRIGLLIDEPTLPAGFCEGADHIMIAARSVRTLQSVCLDALSCVSTRDAALFLRRGS